MLLQVALYIWDNGNGPHLTAVPELCTEPDGSPQSLSHCATSLSEPPLCVSICLVRCLNVIIPALPGERWKGPKLKQQSKTEAIHSELSPLLWRSTMISPVMWKQQPSYTMRYNTVHQPKGTDVWVRFTKFNFDSRQGGNTPPLPSNTLLSPFRF